jgi:hypothetical protein
MSKARKIMKIMYKAMQTEPYKRKKSIRMAKLKKMRKQRNIQNAKDYLAVANAISGKDRIDSRVRVISRKMEIDND